MYLEAFNHKHFLALELSPPFTLLTNIIPVVILIDNRVANLLQICDDQPKGVSGHRRSTLEVVPYCVWFTGSTRKR